MPEKPCPDPAHRHRTAAGRRIQVRRSGVHGKGVFALAADRRGRDASSNTPARSSRGSRRSAAIRTIPTTRTTRSSSTSTTSTSSTAARRQRGEVDQPRVRAELRGRRDRRRPRLHQGAARHRARRGAQLRLRPDRSTAATPPKVEEGVRVPLRHARNAGERCSRRRRSAERRAARGDGSSDVAATGSTNDDLLARVRAAAAAGATASRRCLLVAERQTAGRGRHGRRWHATAGASLTFSLAWPLGARRSGRPVARGRRARSPTRSTAGATPPRIGLKWPNDLWLRRSGRGRRSARRSRVARGPQARRHPRRDGAARRRRASPSSASASTSARRRCADARIGRRQRRRDRRRRATPGVDARARRAGARAPRCARFDAARLRRLRRALRGARPAARPRASTAAARRGRRASRPASAPTARCSSTPATGVDRGRRAANGGSRIIEPRGARRAEGVAGGAGRRQPALLRVHARGALDGLVRPARATATASRSGSSTRCGRRRSACCRLAAAASAPPEVRDVLGDADVRRRRGGCGRGDARERAAAGLVESTAAASATVGTRVEATHTTASPPPTARSPRGWRCCASMPRTRRSFSPCPKPR